MGIFNEHSQNNPFSRGTQGAPGVGFRLNSAGDFDISGKKLTNVGAPTTNTDAATKKYVDDSSTSHTSSGLTVNSNIDMKDTYRILNLKSPSDADEPATKQYADSKFLDRGGDRGMIANLVLNNHRIKRVAEPTSSTDATTKNYVDNLARTTLTTATTSRNLDMQNRYRITNLQSPVDPHEPSTKQYVDNTFLERDGSYPMTGNLKMGNHKITGLIPPTVATDATTKKYVDDNILNSSPDLSDYLEKDGSVAMTGNLQMGNKKIVGLATPTANTDAATKKYVDDKPSGGSGDFKRDGTVVMTGNLQMGNHKITGLATPTANTDAATKKYVDDKPSGGSGDFKRDGSVAMTSNLNMGSNRIVSLADPINPTDSTNISWVKNQIQHFNVLSSPVFTITPAPAYTSIHFQNQRNRFVATTSRPGQPLVSWRPSKDEYLNKIEFNFGGRTINVKKVSFVARTSGISDVDFWVSHSHTGIWSLDIHKTWSYEMSGVYLDYTTDSDSSHTAISAKIFTGKPSAATRDFNLITFTSPTKFTKSVKGITPTTEDEFAVKSYVDHAVSGPSHYKNVFSYLMEGSSQWSDEITTRTSFVFKYIRDLDKNSGNFHSYNLKTIKFGLKKYSGGYRPKFGINFYRLAPGDYTICLEFLNTDYTLWHKTQINLDHQSSSGIIFLHESIKKLQYTYQYPSNQVKYMYYHRVILSFKKSNIGSAFLHITVDIPQKNNDMISYPAEFSNFYVIVYGVEGSFGNVDPNQSFDYHTAFDIQPTKVVYNVDVDLNNKKIINLAEDTSNTSSAATYGMVKDLRHNMNVFLFNLFKDVWDFSRWDKYGLVSSGSSSSSNVTFNRLYNLKSTLPITFPAKPLSNIVNKGLNITNFTLTIPLENNTTDLNIIFVFRFWSNRDFTIIRYDEKTNTKLLEVKYENRLRRISLISGAQTTYHNSSLNSLNGQIIVLQITQTRGNQIRVKINSDNPFQLKGRNIISAVQQKITYQKGDGELFKVCLSNNVNIRSDIFQLIKKFM